MPKRDQINANGATDAPTPTEPVWFSHKQAAEYAQKSKQTIKNAIKRYPLIFSADSQRSQTYHPDFPPVAEISKSALDAWLAASVKGSAVGTRKARSDGRRIMIRVKDEDRENVAAVLAPFGIKLEIAYKSRAKSASAQNAPASAIPSIDAATEDPAPARDNATFETDLVEA